MLVLLVHTTVLSTWAPVVLALLSLRLSRVLSLGLPAQRNPKTPFDLEEQAMPRRRTALLRVVFLFWVWTVMGFIKRNCTSRSKARIMAENQKLTFNN